MPDTCKYDWGLANILVRKKQRKKEAQTRGNGEYAESYYTAQQWSHEIGQLT